MLKSAGGGTEAEMEVSRAWEGESMVENGGIEGAK